MPGNKLLIPLVVLLAATTAASKGLETEIAALSEAILGEMDRKLEVTREELELEISGLRNEVKELKENAGRADIILLSGEDLWEPSTCPRVCSGTTRRGDTNWVASSYKGTDFYVDVDMEGCGFTTVPTVTTALEGVAGHSAALGASSVFEASNKTFRVYIHPNNRDVDIWNVNSEIYMWSLQWIAVGQTC